MPMRGEPMIAVPGVTNRMIGASSDKSPLTGPEQDRSHWARYWGPRWESVGSRVAPRFLGSADQFTVLDVGYDELQSSEHSHDWDSLHLVLRGQVADCYDGQSRGGGPGTLLLYRAGIPHRTHVTRGSRVIHMPFSGHSLPGDRRLTDQALSIGSFALTRTLQLFAASCATAPGTAADKESGWTPAGAQLEQQVLDAFCRLDRFRRHDGHAHRAMHVLQSKADSCSLASLADRVGISRSQLARSFREVYDCSVGEMTQRIRVTRAFLLLVESHAPLAQVAHHAGFSDQSHMGRMFKEVLGMTPGHVRRIAAR